MPSISRKTNSWRFCSATAAFAALLLALQSIAPAAARDAAPKPPTLEQTLNAISAYAPKALAEQGAPGVSIAITDATHTLRVITIGYADAEAKAPVTPQTRFGIGSLSKSFLGTLLLQLRDEGKFDPQLPVTHYLPWFKVQSAYRPITSADLLTHSSGLPDGGLATGLDGVYQLRNWPTGFAPGTHWSYSNVGYYALGAILEKIVGSEDYNAIITRRIFDPLGMDDTTALWSPRTLADAAKGYLYSDDDEPLPYNDPLTRVEQTHYEDPAGSILTTPGDMAKYARFIINKGEGPHARLLTESSWRLLTVPPLYDGKPIGAGGQGIFAGYAYGLGSHVVDGDTVVGHTGGVLPYTACMQVDLTHGYGIVAMSNIGYRGARPCGIVTYALQALIAYANGKPLPAPPPAKDPLLVERASQYAGTFSQVGGKASINVATTGDRLGLMTPKGLIKLYPAGRDNFVVGDPAWAAYLLQFGRDANGNVVEAFWGPQWYTSSAYSGPKTFSYPNIWNAYVGRYETLDANGYYNEVTVIVRKGQLCYDDGTRLTPLGGALFHVGTSTWTPDYARFSEIIEGKARVLSSPGVDMYRMITSPG